MSAISFIYEVNATSAKEAYDKLYEEACRDANPNDSYNGTITTCSLSGGRTISDKYSDKVRKQAMDLIERNDNGVKWEAKWLDCGVVEYEVVKVKKTTHNQRRKPQYKTMYVVLSGCLIGDEKEIQRYETKTEADKAAVEYKAKNPHKKVWVLKKPVDINCGDPIVTDISCDIKKYKSKPKSKSLDVREIRKYLLYGWAAC